MTSRGYFASVLLVIVEIAVSFGVFALEDGRAYEAEHPDTNEDPEGVVELKIAVIVNKLSFARVVTGEEESPGAHEEVRACEGGRDKNDALSEVAGSDAAESSHDDRDKPVAPDSFPAADAVDHSVDESTGEETSDQTNEADHDPDVTSDDTASDDSENKSDRDASPSATSGEHPAESKRHAENESDGEDSD